MASNFSATPLLDRLFYENFNPASLFPLTVLFSIAVAIFVTIVLPLTRPKDLPPVIPSGIPVIGGLIQFLRGPLPLIKRVYPTLGSVFTVPLLHKRITFMLGPEVASHFFKASEDDLSQKEVYGYSVPTFGPGVVFDVPYSVRLEQFRFFAESLKVIKLKTYVDMMVQEAQDHFAGWGSEGTVDLKEELSSLIIATASRCLLGREVREKMFAEVAHLFHELDVGMMPISVIAPYLPLPAHRRRDKARKELERIFEAIIKERKASGKKEEDMLQTFIDSTYRSTGRPTSEAEVTGLLIAALFAGQHTSSITSTWTGAYLMKYPQFTPAVLAEQSAILARHGPALNYAVLGEMECLQRVIKEALRLNPPLIMLLRYNHRAFSVDTREGATYTIPKGHIVATSPYISNRLSHVFTNPEEFDPQRYAPGREEDKAQPFSHTTFGGGRHGCMGETFAYLQVKTVWSVLLRNFEFELDGPFPEPDFESLVVGPKGSVMVKYKRRELSK